MENEKLKLNSIYQGDVIDVLKTFPDKSVNMIITSPPYWALRDYRNEKQIGMEKTFYDYIDKLISVFAECWRVLKDDGSLWVNIGDTYYTKSGGKFENDLIYARGGSKEMVDKTTGINKANELRGKIKKFNKSLCLIPQRFSIAMMEYGWKVRNEIIWYKPSCLPSSVPDRFTVDFEKLFFFVKQDKYYFKQQLEPVSENYANDKRPNGVLRQKLYENSKYVKEGMVKKLENVEMSDIPNRNVMRNKRCVWAINPKPIKEAHFAPFPPKLIETPIKACCPENGVVLDLFIGSGTTAIVSE